MDARNVAMTDSTGDAFEGLRYLESSRGGARLSLSRRRIARPLMGAGLAVAMGVAFGFGVLALRNYETSSLLEPSDTASLAIPMEIAAPEAQPAPAAASAPMDVLPDDRSAAARPPVPTSAASDRSVTHRADPAFSCRRQDTQSERLVCGDAELRRLDRAMNRAFDKAVAAGVPYRSLRQDQDDWLRVREDAAQHEPDGVAGMYRQRIAELQEMAANV